jgi:PAS domain S-box-containing protein
VYLTCNPAFERLFGASEAEIVGKSDFDFVDREQAEFFREHDRKAVAAGKASTNEETLTFAVDGYRGIFETTKTPMYDPRGELIGVLGIAHDVTERKHRVAQIEKLSKLYTTLSYTNQAIVHSKNQAELFEKVCSSAVDHGGFTMAWVGLIDAETHMIRPVSIHGEGTAFIENIRLSIDAESPFGGGPTGIALRQRQPYWCQDFLHDEITRPWHEQARETGYAASAVLPVWQQQEVIGSFNLYASEVDAFDEAARALLQEMVADIGFALENFDREARRRGIEQRLDLVIEGSSDAPWDWDLMNDEIYYSPQWWRMFGYGDDELPGDTDIWRQLCHPEDIDRVEEVLLQVQRPGHARDSVESRFRHKDGHYVPILIRGIVSRDEAGNPVRLTGTFMDLTEQKATENRLREQLEELNRWFKATIGREERIIELKQEVNLLLQQRQLPPRYASVGSDETAEKGDTVNG